MSAAIQRLRSRGNCATPNSTADRLVQPSDVPRLELEPLQDIMQLFCSGCLLRGPALLHFGAGLDQRLKRGG